MVHEGHRSECIALSTGENESLMTKICEGNGTALLKHTILRTVNPTWNLIHVPPASNLTL